MACVRSIVSFSSFNHIISFWTIFLTFTIYTDLLKIDFFCLICLLVWNQWANTNFWHITIHNSIFNRFFLTNFWQWLIISQITENLSLRITCVLICLFRLKSCSLNLLDLLISSLIFISSANLLICSDRKWAWGAVSWSSI